MLYVTGCLVSKMRLYNMNQVLHAFSDCFVRVIIDHIRPVSKFFIIQIFSESIFGAFVGVISLSEPLQQYVIINMQIDGDKIITVLEAPFFECDMCHDFSLDNATTTGSGGAIKRLVRFAKIHL